MSHQNYGPIGVGGFSPLGDDSTIYRSPVSYQQPFPAYDPAEYHHGDLGGGIEMEEHARPHMPAHQDSKNTVYSTASTLFPSDEQSFLHDPLNHLDSTFMSNSFQPYHDNTGRQWRHIFITSLARWLITAGLCAAMIWVTIWWQKQPVVSEGSKKLYNTITTAISIALGLNIASAFKDMALNMRWPILSARARNLVELDLILNADSMTKLTKLVFVTRRPMVIFGCLFWLLMNLLAQSGIAMLSLTYGFDTSTTGVIFTPGNVSVPNMAHFYPQGDTPKAPSLQDEEYTAHVFGESAFNYYINYTAYMPTAGSIYNPQGAMLFYANNSNVWDFVFSDSPTNSYLSTYSAYTARQVNVTYVCESHQVTKNGNGTSDLIEVADVGEVTLSQTVPNSITYFTNKNHLCESSNRCSVVEAFESFADNPWYYKCNITMGKTFNDPSNVSYISDYMAQIATASIAQIGYTDSNGQASQIYPKDSPWGIPNNGSADDMGWTIALWAIATIAGATLNNPITSYEGQAPNAGQALQVGHHYYFYFIIGLIAGCHLLFCIVVAILANRVMVGPDGHLSMSLLLKPVADALEGVSAGIENKAYRDAKRNTTVRYEKARNGRWILNMIDR